MFPILMAGSVNLSDFPQNLATALNISLFPAQLLTVSLFIMLVDFPLLILTKGKNVNLLMIATFLMLGFSVAMTWLPVWMLLVIVLMIAIGFADIARKWLSGHI